MIKFITKNLAEIKEIIGYYINTGIPDYHKNIEEIKKIFGYDSLVLDKYDSVDCDDIRAIFWFENNKVESVTVY